MRKLDPAILAKAKEQAKKAAYTPRTWEPVDVITLEELVELSGGTSDLEDADRKGMATYDIEYNKKGEPFFKLYVPLIDGSVSEVRPSKRIRNDCVEGDTFKVKDLRAILCKKGKEVTFTFDVIYELGELLAKLEANK